MHEYCKILYGLNNEIKEHIPLTEFSWAEGRVRACTAPEPQLPSKPLKHMTFWGYFMPKPVEWSFELDTALHDLLAKRRVSLRVAEQALGVSRSVLAKRAYVIGARQMDVAGERGFSGSAPLPAGHPITWGAICEAMSGQGDAYPLPVFL